MSIEQKEINDAICIVERLFNLYVKNKTFNKSRIEIEKGQTGPHYIPGWGKESGSSPSTLITYRHDGVLITHYSRVTCHIDDVDRFVDFKVIVDGKTVVEKNYT